MLERLFALETFGIKLGLANITSLCEALDHPERSFAAVHVAGTNGKGSVTAMIHAGLRGSGIHAARYTSPHLTDIRERFVIGGEPVDAALLHSAAACVLDTADALVSAGTLPAPPTFFEATTAIAFELFRRARVEAAVIEVGLGGRFDATNVIDPRVTVITSIALDHQQQLGDTLPAIAYEKAGILKSGVPVVIGSLGAQSETVVRRVAAERGADVVSALDGVRAPATLGDDGRAVLQLSTPSHQYGAVRLGLRGEHQVGNALVALRTMEVLRHRGLALPFDAIARGLTEASWPGRLEMIELGGGRVLLDAAHNPDGASALSRYLATCHPERMPLVVAVMRDKDVAGILQALLPAVGSVFVTAPPTERALDPGELARAVLAIDPAREVIVVRAPLEAIDGALARGPTVCVAGSIFLIGAVRDALRERAILR